MDEDGKLIKMEVKPGDKVLYGKYAGTEVTLDNETYMILREDDILGILAGAPELVGAGTKKK